MTPRDFQDQAVQKRLVAMRRMLGELATHEGTTAANLSGNLSSLYAVYYMLSQIIDLATDINQHIAATALDNADAEGRRGFEDLVRAGVLPRERLQAFHRSAALRNVITHQYVEVDLGIVARAIPLTVELYTEYVRAVASWMAER